MLAAAVTAGLAEALTKRTRRRLAKDFVCFCSDVLRGWRREAKMSANTTAAAPWPQARPLRATQRSVETTTEPPEVEEEVVKEEAAAAAVDDEDGMYASQRNQSSESEVVGATTAAAESPMTTTTSEQSPSPPLTTEQLTQSPPELLASTEESRPAGASGDTVYASTSSPASPAPIPGSLRFKHAQQRQQGVGDSGGHQIHIHIHQPEQLVATTSARDHETEAAAAAAAAAAEDDKGDEVSHERGGGGGEGGGFSPENTAKLATATDEAAEAVGVAVRGLLALWQVSAQDEEHPEHPTTTSLPASSSRRRSSSSSSSPRGSSHRSPRLDPVPEVLVEDEGAAAAAGETSPSPMPVPGLELGLGLGPGLGLELSPSPSPSLSPGELVTTPSPPTLRTPTSTASPTTPTPSRMCRVIYTERGGALLLTPGARSHSPGGVGGDSPGGGRKTYVPLAEYLDGVNRAALSP
jgi:hypothetical protein